MRWLVTGGCGFIGRNLIKALLRRRGDTVRVVDDLSVGTREQLNAIGACAVLDAGKLGAAAMHGAPSARIELVARDIRDADLAGRASVGVDVIVHLAANTGVGLHPIDVALAPQ